MTWGITFRWRSLPTWWELLTKFNLRILGVIMLIRPHSVPHKPKFFELTFKRSKFTSHVLTYGSYLVLWRIHLFSIQLFFFGGGGIRNLIIFTFYIEILASNHLLYFALPRLVGWVLWHVNLFTLPNQNLTIVRKTCLSM